jgi:thiol-disulfide isomerase/thioredoxin
LPVDRRSTIATNPQTGKTPRRRRPVLLVLIGMAVLAAVAVLVTWKSGLLGQASGAEERRPVTVKGEALPVLPDGAPAASDPARGRPMPEIRGASFTGEPVAITGDGHPKVILFLAHWCPHCQNEVPRLTAWLKGGGLPQGVEFYAVSTAAEAKRPNYPPSRWLQQEGWPAPVIADDQRDAVAGAAGLSAFPFFVFVGADGKVAGRHAGELSIEELKERITSLARS